MDKHPMAAKYIITARLPNFQGPSTIVGTADTIKDAQAQRRAIERTGTHWAQIDTNHFALPAWLMVD